MSQWNRGEKLAALSLVVAFLAIVVAIATPEIRTVFGIASEAEAKGAASIFQASLKTTVLRGCALIAVLASMCRLFILAQRGFLSNSTGKRVREVLLIVLIPWVGMLAGGMGAGLLASLTEGLARFLALKSDFQSLMNFYMLLLAPLFTIAMSLNLFDDKFILHETSANDA